MAVHLVIDGYNLTAAMTASGSAAMDLEEIREALIRRLAAYNRIKRHRITVVFDGKKSVSLSRGRMNQSGIEIRFSRYGEEADQILKEIAMDERDKMTLVTSDRAVASFAEAQGAVTVPSDEFNEILLNAEYADMKGTMDLDEESDVAINKKGNPRRLSKQEKKRIQRIKKL
jgi:hypothetical protein